MINGKHITILLPVRNDWPSLVRLLPEIDEVINGIGCTARVLIVDDGSTDYVEHEKLNDMTFASIKCLNELTLIRNQGNQRAIAIGVGYIKENFETDYLIVMDSDHEDKPTDIPYLLEKCDALEDKCLVFAERTVRSEGLIFKFMYLIYQWVFRLLTGAKIKYGNFSVVPNSLIPTLSHVTEIWNHYSAGIMRSKLPFAFVSTTRGKRIHGRSSMNLVNLINHAINGFSVYGDIVGTRLLVMSCFFGGAVFLLMSMVVFIWLFTTILLKGWASVFIMLMVVIFFQICCFSLLMSFNVAQSRLHPELIPSKVYQNYLMKVSSYI